MNGGLARPVPGSEGQAIITSRVEPEGVDKAPLSRRFLLDFCISIFHRLRLRGQFFNKSRRFFPPLRVLLAEAPSSLLDYFGCENGRGRETSSSGT